MKPFNQSLQQAKKRHQRLYLLMLFGLMLIGLLILTVLLVSRGTRIIVQPDAALPASVSVEQGLGIALFGSVYSLTASPTIRITAERYYPHEQVLQPAEQGQVLTVTLKPLPSKVTFTTDLADGRTTWQLNNDVIAVADTLEQTLPPSDYQLSINHPHYQPEIIDFSLAAGEQLEQTVSFTPLAGELQIESTPAGATVTIDGEKVGETPLEIPVAGGFYDVALSMPEFAPSTETIEITQQTTTAERHYRLQAEQASIELDLQPTGGTLTVNGIVVNATDRLLVEAGKNHQITYQKPGYVPQTQSATLNSKQSTSLVFDLPEENGDVSINANPAATVKINGKEVGSTPLNLSLQAVPQEITLSRPGYRAVSQTVTPSSASAKTVSVTLLPEAEAQLAEAPRSYQTAAGGEMVLFTPNETFTMGAARDEAGQRANEFLRQVKLSRPFYAGVHEVTNREYQQFKGDQQGDASMPVTSVSWLQAVQFSNWLSRKENLQPVYALNNGELTGIDDNAN
ncbi:MAG TPA: PEGA domain-containing protein, partial [Methylophaga sp.]|nr:PEGA domain-containing protein [Methylophaga sp.]